MQKALTDETGNRYGRLLVTGQAPSVRLKNGKNRRKVFATCDCGVSKDYTLAKLRYGSTQSCGCLKLQHITTHGLSKKYKDPAWKVYSAWNDMKNRCLCKTHRSYPSYGGRGITVHEPWHAFEVFFRDMGMPPSKAHSLGRIDNDGGYHPGNVEWQTMYQQMRNTRKSRYLEFEGKRMILTDWAHAVGMKPILLTTRLRAGWSVERALTEPIHNTGKRSRQKC